MPKFAGESEWTSDWWTGSRVPYHEYLQARQGERSLRFGIEEQTRTIIGSIEELRSVGFEIRDTIEDGFEQVSADLGQISGDLRTIDSTLSWGFSGVLLRLDRIASALDHLGSLIENRSKTRSYDRAKKAISDFQRGLHPQALTTINEAIEGFGGEPGLDTDAHLQQILGTIRLGSLLSADPDVVSPALAETAFLNAARFAWPSEAESIGLAYTGAARAALVQGFYDRSIDHGIKAIEAFPEGEIPFSREKIKVYGKSVGTVHVPVILVIAKASAGKGDFEQVRVSLDAAFCTSPPSATIASGDAEYANGDARRAFIEARNSAFVFWKERFGEHRRELKGELARLESFQTAEIQTKVIIADEIAKATRDFSQLTSISGAGTLIGYWTGSPKLAQKRNFTKEFLPIYKSRALDTLVKHGNELFELERQRKKEFETIESNAGRNSWLLAVSLVWVVFGLGTYAFIRTVLHDEISFWIAFSRGPLLLWPITGAALLLIRPHIYNMIRPDWASYYGDANEGSRKALDSRREAVLASEW